MSGASAISTADTKANRVGFTARHLLHVLSMATFYYHGRVVYGKLTVQAGVGLRSCPNKSMLALARERNTARHTAGVGSVINW